MDHDHLVDVTYPVRSYLTSSLTAYLICLEGDVLVAILSASQYTRVRDISWSMSTLFHLYRRIILKVVLSIESLILVETFSPSTVFFFCLRIWGRQ